jgi:hypothetical protein
MGDEDRALIELVVTSDNSNEKKWHMLMVVIDGHYWEAKAMLDGQPLSYQRRIYGKRYCHGYELDIDVYTRNWLHANSDALGSELMEHVKEYGYSPEASKYLLKGQKMYAIPVEQRHG